MRFSTVAGELGSADTVRDPRGFAVKFYSEEGNWDLVGNNTPVFFIKDPSKFPDFILSQKRHPVTGFRDSTMQWDFWSFRYDHRVETDYYTQAGNLFRLMDDAAKAHLISNIVNAMQGVPRAIQERQIIHFTKADPAYGAGVAKGLGI